VAISRRWTCLLPMLIACAHPRAAQAEPTDGRAVFDQMQALLTDVAADVLPSVVHVEAIVKRGGRRDKITGSGFFIDRQGYIVTNEHVVDRATKVEITRVDQKRRVPAEIIGTDKLTDLALLKIDPEAAPVKPARLGDDETVEVGEWVIAVGNPYGLDGTVSFGIISAKGRDLAREGMLNEFLQTDAMIDFGSSGGPLVNLEGEVIGVNSMGQGRGIGFTIPISTARDVIARLRRGPLARGWLGVVVQPLNRDLAAYLGKPQMTGVRVAQVVEAGPAARAGLRVDDVVTAVDGKPVVAEAREDLNQFRRLIAARMPDTRVELRVYRDGATKTIEVTTGRQPKLTGAEFETDFGFNVQELTPTLRLQRRVTPEQGVIVTHVERGSPASEADLNVGDVIIGLERRPVTDFADFRRRLTALPPHQPFLLEFWRNGGIYAAVVKPFAPQQSTEAIRDD